jgi:hypothetical protein
MCSLPKPWGPPYFNNKISPGPGVAPVAPASLCQVFGSVSFFSASLQAAANTFPAKLPYQGYTQFSSHAQRLSAEELLLLQ